MSRTDTPVISTPSYAIASRFAFRELRGGLKGFYVFLACILLGVATIAGVGSLSRAMTEGIAAEGQTILGGDLAFSIVHREATPEERTFLESLGNISEVATLRAMARVPQEDSDANRQALVEVKAIDGPYPLYGTLDLEDGGNVHDRLGAAGSNADGTIWGAAVDPTLLARLGLQKGDTLSLGRTTLKVTGVIAGEPDFLGSGAAFGPRLMIGREALDASTLIQPGSLVRWRYRVRLAENRVASEAEIAAATERAKERFPDAGWRIRSRANAAPGLSVNIKRLAQFLTLVGLTALVVGGVGIANAVRSHLDGRREVIATFKCLGADGDFVFKVYLVQILAIALIGIAVGLVIGAILPNVAGALLADILPFKTAFGVYPRELLLALVYGVLTTLTFAVWPLGRAHDVPPTALFRDHVAASRTLPRWRYVVATGAAVVALTLIAVTLAEDRRIALIYVAATLVAFAILRLVAVGVMALARAVPRPRRTELRLAVANIHRPGALTPTVVLSLGLGLALIVTLALIDGNLRRELTSDLPEQAPSFFFIDIQTAEVPAFEELLARVAPDGKQERVPMLRGRITKLNGTPASEYEAEPGARWVLRGDRGITYDADPPRNTEILSGTWWPKDYQGEPLVSFAAELAGELGLKVGDTITVNVLGREITARIANLRTVEWRSLSINFVMVFSPNTFAGAPHPHLATLTFPDGGTREKEMAVLRAVSDAFPTVTAVRVKDALTMVNDLVGKLALAIRSAASITLIASVLVLAGALASGHRHRIYDAVILKTLGATRMRLIAAFGLEYLLIGLATAIFGVVAGALAAWAVLTGVMNMGFTFLPEVAATSALGALIVTLAFGLFGTWRVLGEKPAPVLRNL
ncbi:putative ABC transport system permease protein [Rhodobium orientis]|uniref:Glycosyl transferase family 1 n=1 Tax=Rhodobium orientis TaxID=34017 RepID=A0A327JJP9_9HYPH|nr:ABC transporter permease [Rhodobium orientis]MBB4305172.1 putative ABC transport system permease protein [Rhodobium orientis]MBK5949244.1 glycosyl transferase family 1 [Rhodobium orientis]RAI26660.1 glycosyl transferase family 1 [Rhodobium orientis]